MFGAGPSGGGDGAGPVRRFATGRFQGRELVVYTVALSSLFWGLILLARLGYPAANGYSLSTHTFSYLGRFEAHHNPDWWWVFGLAMTVWGVAAIPLVVNVHHRFRGQAGRGAGVGAALLLTGCGGTVLVGLFPDVPADWWGGVTFRDIHLPAAVLAAAGYILGIAWHGGLLYRFRHSLVPPRWPVVAPFALVGGVVGSATLMLLSWPLVYAARQRAAGVAGEAIESVWSAALGSPFAFPLWENLTILALFLFLTGFPLALARRSLSPP